MVCPGTFHVKIQLEPWGRLMALSCHVFLSKIQLVLVDTRSYSTFHFIRDQSHHSLIFSKIRQETRWYRFSNLENGIMKLENSHIVYLFSTIIICINLEPGKSCRIMLIKLMLNYKISNHKTLILNLCKVHQVFSLKVLRYL